MKLSIQRELLLRPLQTVSNVIERRQTLPVLSNVLMSLRNNTLTLTGTDLEVEMVAQVVMDSSEEGEITLPARKFLDICRALPEDAVINIEVDNTKARIRSGRSRFSLSTLPASDYPNIDPITSPFEFTIVQSVLKRLIEQTQFSMAQQDVRYYLNGLMFEFSPGKLSGVATDGHRLALCQTTADTQIEDNRQVIIPRKGILELVRLLEDTDSEVKVHLGINHMRMDLPDVSFTTKLIDGKFPDYQQVIPKNPTKVVTSDRSDLLQSLSRASVLSNEKYRGMRLQLVPGLLKATIHNPEQEEAEEELEVDYQGEEFEIGFNVSYFIDVLSVIPGKKVELHFTDSNHSCLINATGDTDCQYVIMPMRL
ncbi:MAG: DNA polymerase III subunit beta [Proteobacteria bacterium]|jgi:DNA polymerase III subunit beta|nr:DNA polymerase III subunit beta [Pseudomonadota bacterium]